MEETKEIAKELLPQTKGFNTAELTSVEHIAGDASGRKFFRLFIKGGAADSLVLMHLNSKVKGDKKWTQDDTFVELSSFFSERGVKVPLIQCDCRKQGYLLVDDFGDIALWQFVLNRLGEEGRILRDQLGEKATEILYQRTVDIIPVIQACEKPPCYSLQEEMDFDFYRMEVQRMVDYYLVPNGFSKSGIEAISGALDALSEEMASHPRVLIHRDFMPWNIQVISASEIGILDFQDAFMGSPAYDLVSLLHDRDVDFILGRDFLERTIQYYQEKAGSGDIFLKQYRQALLQRFCRLAGQFVNLTKSTGNPVYQNWVPGCFRRIGAVMESEEYFSDSLQILYDRIPEFRKGVDDPWKLS